MKSKKIMSVILVVAMLLTAAPLQGFVGLTPNLNIDFDSLFNFDQNRTSVCLICPYYSKSKQKRLI